MPKEIDETTKSVVSHTQDYVTALLEESKQEKPAEMLVAKVVPYVPINSHVLMMNAKRKREEDEEKRSEREESNKAKKQKRFAKDLFRHATAFRLYCISCKCELAKLEKSHGCDHCYVYYTCSRDPCRKQLEIHEDDCGTMTMRPDMLDLLFNQ